MRGRDRSTGRSACASGRSAERRRASRHLSPCEQLPARRRDELRRPGSEIRPPRWQVLARVTRRGVQDRRPGDRAPRRGPPRCGCLGGPRRDPALGRGPDSWLADWANDASSGAFVGSISARQPGASSRTCHREGGTSPHSSGPRATTPAGTTDRPPARVSQRSPGRTSRATASSDPSSSGDPGQ